MASGSMSDLVTFEDSAVDEEEEEVLTAAEVLEKLEEAWLNEKFSPDLLEAKTDLVECMLEQIHEMEENIRRAKRGDVKVSIHRMEINRIRYIISSYLRIRLEKIEKYTSHILKEEGERGDEESPHLTPEEYTFAKEYSQSMETHFKNLALKNMPQNLQTLDPKQTAVRPNLDSYVFLKVNEDTEGILVEEETLDAGEEIIDFEKGDQHIMRYRPIASLVSSAVITLI